MRARVTLSSGSGLLGRIYRDQNSPQEKHAFRLAASGLKGLGKALRPWMQTGPLPIGKTMGETRNLLAEALAKYKAVHPPMGMASARQALQETTSHLPVANMQASRNALQQAVQKMPSPALPPISNAS